MHVPANVHRSVDRHVAVLFRMSVGDKELLRSRAAEAGLTIQAYLEQQALGRVVDLGQPRPQQELPLTG